MKRKQRNVLCLSVLSVLSLTSCGSSVPADWADGIVWEHAGQTAYNALKDEERKGVYNYYESYMPASLNSVVTMQSEDARHITNLVDGLVDVDRTGKIIPSLAESWAWTDEATMDEITFNIRQNVPWVVNAGDGSETFKDPVTKAEAMVSANDWVSAAKANLNAANGSESSYLLYMFIEGGEEYYLYTLLQYRKNNGFGVISKAKLDAATAEEKESAAYKTCAASAGGMSSPKGSCFKWADTALFTDEYIAANLKVDVGELSQIENFSRVGVKASADGKKLTYKLNGTTPYFLTALTYTPYFPIYQPFVDSIGGIDQFGTAKEKVLVNGAFVMKKFKMGSGTSIKYIRNSKYWDVKNVHLYEVNAKQIPATTSSSTGRVGYEKGITDGFTVVETDSVGWEKYVTGKDGTGTRDNPVSPDAHAVEGLGDGSTFALLLNMNRNSATTALSNTIMGSSSKYNIDANNDGQNDTVENTNKALSVSPALRKLVLQAYDFQSSVRQDGTSDYDRTKQIVNTWVPAHFITYADFAETDKAEGILGNDFVDFTKKAFVDKFYGDKADKYDPEGEAFKAAEAALNYGQISSGAHGLNLDTERASGEDEWDWKLTAKGETQLAALKADAQAEINAWNESHADDKISTPVVIEYAGLTYNDESNKNDGETINSTNARIAGGCWLGGNDLEQEIGRPSDAQICTAQQENSMIVRFVKNNSTNVPDANAYSRLSQSSNATLIVSGWGPDYSDPLTFANTVVYGGDLSNNMGMNDDNPYSEEVKKSWKKYDELVDKASALTDEKERFKAFAEAEIELLYEINILKPVKERGLGKSVVVSKTVPFRVTSAVYGVSSYKYKYIEVLTRTIKTAEYNALKAERYI